MKVLLHLGKTALYKERVLNACTHIWDKHRTSIDCELRIVFPGVEKFLFHVKFTDKKFNFTTLEVTGRTV